MNRDQKTAAIDELAENLGEASAIFAVDYRGISVPQAKELRIKLRDADATFKVVKNRLAKRAVEQAGTAGELDELLSGPIALTFIKGDAVIAAKAISTFTKEHDVLEFKGGLMDGAVLNTDGFTAIARLPAIEVLHGRLVGLTASPLTGLLAGMSNLISGLGRQLAQIAEQGLVSGEAPAEETSAEEPQDEETQTEQPSETEQEQADPDAPGREAEEAAGEETEETDADQAESEEADAGEASEDEQEDQQ